MKLSVAVESEGDEYSWVRPRRLLLRVRGALASSDVISIDSESTNPCVRLRLVRADLFEVMIVSESYESCSEENVVG